MASKTYAQKLLVVKKAAGVTTSPPARTTTHLEKPSKHSATIAATNLKPEQLP